MKKDGSHGKEMAADNYKKNIRLELTCLFTSSILLSSIKARGVGFEPTCLFRHGISNPTPYQARRPPPLHLVFGIIGCACKNVTFDGCRINAYTNVNQR